MRARAPQQLSFGPAPSGSQLKAIVAQVARSESEFRAARDHYTYRQTFEFIEEGGGTYRAVTDVTFTPDGKRIEQALKSPLNTLKRIRLTEEDFRDLAEVQPFVLETEDLWNYEVAWDGEEMLGAVPAVRLRVRPRQTLEGQRLFEGLVWVSQSEMRVLKVEGRAVPVIVKHGEENLFPRFTTFREKIDGQNWFPVLTEADDSLQFKTGPIRVHLKIRYEKYKRFESESHIEFQPQ